MLRRYFEENRQKLHALSLLIFFVLVLGIVTGSMFYVKTGVGRSVINDKVSDAFLKLSKPENGLMFAKTFFIENLICCTLIFISAYFKLGSLISVGIIIRKGFVTGFTTAAAVGAYGLSGAALMSTTAFDLIISTAVLIMLAAVSASYSMASEKKSKKFLIFFMIFSISIFCVISFSRGFMTTTFMKMIYPKIT